MTAKQILENNKKIVEMIYAQFGESCNVTLYEVKKGNGTVIATRGKMLSESVGDKMPDYIAQMIRNAGEAPDNLYGFINREHVGYLLRTSLDFIYDDNEKLIGCLCISHNLMQIKMIISFLEEFYRTDRYLEERELQSDKQFTSVQDYVSQTIDNFMTERLGGVNFASLPRNDKLRFIEELEQKGIFQVKGSVEMIAQKVNLTKFAIYNYLCEIRSSDSK